jgi:hypothetical protein
MRVYAFPLNQIVQQIAVFHQENALPGVICHPLAQGDVTALYYFRRRDCSTIFPFTFGRKNHCPLYWAYVNVRLYCSNRLSLKIVLWLLRDYVRDFKRQFTDYSVTDLVVMLGCFE